MSTLVKEQTKKTLNVNDLKTGDILSEVCHYKFVEKRNGKNVFLHLQSGKEVILPINYLEQGHVISAEQYFDIVKVGKEDKYWTKKQIDDASKNKTIILNKEGDLKTPGIITLWNSIPSNDVFSVCFTKQDEVLTSSKLEDIKKSILNEKLSVITKAAKSKKGVAKAAEEAIKHLINNPVLNYIPGEERVLRGFKVEFDSSTGYFKCFDTDKNSIRNVNINTIKWLVYKGIKYEVVK